jgi:hypothetical protein
MKILEDAETIIACLYCYLMRMLFIDINEKEVKSTGGGGFSKN